MAEPSTTPARRVFYRRLPSEDGRWAEVTTADELTELVERERADLGVEGLKFYLPSGTHTIWFGRCAKASHVLGWMDS
jgi:hypothetical protein